METERERDWKGPQPEWLVAMRFGERMHLEAFRRGQIYTKPLDTFARMESDALRKDRFEGACRITQPHEIKAFRIKSADGTEIVLAPKDFAGPILMGYGPEVSCNVFCMFSITEPANDFCDARNLGFGDSFVIVLDTSEFLRRVDRAAEKRGLKLDAGLVEYFDSATYSGRTGPFRKPGEFAYQKEFRLAFYPGSAAPYVLDVGDLTDITTPAEPLAEINRLCDFGLHSAKEAGLE